MNAARTVSKRTRIVQPVTRLMLIPLLLGSTAFAKVRPAGDRVDAIVGHPLVLAVVADEASDFREPPEAGLDDGRGLGVEVFRLVPAAPVDGGWIGPVARWHALPAREALRRDALPLGAWYAVIDLPIDAVSQGLWIDGERYEVNWLPDPERASLEAGGRPLWASPVDDAARASASFEAAMDAIAGDPFQAWRVRLIADGITPTGGEDRTGAQGTELDAVRSDLATTDAQRFLDELARSHTARWQLILGRLALSDAETASRMRRWLGGSAWIGGAWRPVWAPDSLALRALQVDLLSPFVDDQTRALRARAWLDSQPTALAWVIDDAAAEDLGDGRLNPTLGVLSLPARDAPMVVEVAGPIGAPDLITAQPRRMTTVEASVAMLETRGRSLTTRTNSIPVRIGRAELNLDAVATIAGARPPGVRIGPLRRAWTMPALVAGTPDAGASAAPGRGATGLVRRMARPYVADSGEGWSVFMRLDAPEGARDAATVWTGPYGLPRGVWRVGRDGSVRTLFGAAPAEVSIVETETGWAFDLRLPASAIDPDGVLRVGVERDLDGERSAWPRRMLPDQEEPGRLPIDTRTWSGF